jgi:hypothetical protein
LAADIFDTSMPSKEKRSEDLNEDEDEKFSCGVFIDEKAKIEVFSFQLDQTNIGFDIFRKNPRNLIFV